MAALYADEHVPPELTARLRAHGHDVLRAQEDGRAGQGIPDPLVLAWAVALGRAVVTNNRWDYHALHAAVPGHAGIITYTRDDDQPEAVADRIHAAVAPLPSLAGVLVRITKPNRPLVP